MRKILLSIFLLLLMITIVSAGNYGAGNYGAGAYGIGQDTVPPVIIIGSPINATVIQQVIDLNVSTTDNISVWWYSLNNGANTTFTPNTTITSIAGQNTLIIYANDTTGNIGSANANFTSTQCGSTILTSITLTGNMTGTGICFTIGSNNTVVDGNGHYIFGNSSGFGINISTFNNITIKNFKGINNFTNGVYVSRSLNSSIFNNTIIGGIGNNNYGIYLLSNSNGINITSNFINTTGTSSSGIVLTSSFNSTLESNTIYTDGTIANGIDLDSSNTNSMLSNSIKLLSSGSGILVSSSDRNIISTNNITTVSVNGGGLRFTSSNNNTISLNNINTTNTTSIGFRVTTSNNNNISFNTINTIGNQASGLRFDTTSNNNIMSNNIIKTTHVTSAYGVYLVSGNNNIFTNDNITATSVNDIRVDDGVGIFTNGTFNRTDISFDAGGVGNITIKWYIDVKTINSSNVLQNVNTTIFNISNTQVFNGLTDSNGDIVQQSLIEFYQNNNTKTYHTPHTINATLLGYVPTSTSINITSTNSTNITITLSTDVTNPTIILNNPINGSTKNSSTVIFNATTTDNVGIFNVTLYINGVLNSTNSSGVGGEYLFSRTLADATYNWSVLSYDTNNNFNQSTTNIFTVSTNSAPVVTLISPTNQSFDVDGVVTLQFNVTDADGGLVNATIYGDQNSNPTTVIAIINDINSSTGTTQSYTWGGSPQSCTGTSIVSCWHFDGNSTDYGSSVQNLTINGATFTPTGGKYSGGAVFDGVNNSFDFNQTNSYSGSLGTIEAWVYVNTTNADMNSNAYAIFSTSVLGDNNRYMTFYIAGHKLWFQSRKNVDTFPSFYGNTYINAQEWTHVAVTSDGNGYKLYVNGVQQLLSYEHSQNNGDWFSDLSSGTYNTYIGKFRRTELGSTTISEQKMFKGKIDELIIHNTELTGGDLRSHYQQGAYPYYWSVSSTDGTSTTTSSVNNYNVTLNTTTTTLLLSSNLQLLTSNKTAIINSTFTIQHNDDQYINFTLVVSTQPSSGNINVTIPSSILISPNETSQIPITVQIVNSSILNGLYNGSINITAQGDGNHLSLLYNFSIGISNAVGIADLQDDNATTCTGSSCDVYDNVTTGSSITENIRIANLGVADLTSCHVTLKGINSSSYQVTPDVFDVPPQGYTEVEILILGNSDAGTSLTGLLEVSCVGSSEGYRTRYANLEAPYYFVDVVQPTSTGSSGGGGGTTSTTTTITVLSGNATFKLATTFGRDNELFVSTPGSTRTKEIKISNIGTASGSISLSCENLDELVNVCEWVTFSKSNLTLGVNGEESIFYSVTVPSNAEERTYKFNILAVGSTGGEAGAERFAVSLQVGNSILNSLFSIGDTLNKKITLKSPTGDGFDINLPVWSLSLLGMLLSFTVQTFIAVYFRAGSIIYLFIGVVSLLVGAIPILTNIGG